MSVGERAGEASSPSRQPRLRLLDAAPSWEGRPLNGRVLDALCLLAGAPDAAVGEAELIDGLWPRRRPEHPRQSLQVVVSRTRSLLGAHTIERTADGYRLALPSEEVDHLDLLRRVRLATSAAGSRDPARIIELTRGLAVRPGDAGGESGPHGDLRRAADALRRAARRLRALALDSLGRYADAMALLPLLAEEDPADEQVLAALVRDEAWTGSPAAALERYEIYRRRLRDCGAIPGPALRAAHEAALSAERPVRRGIKTVSTGLVGREDDLRAVEESVATSRLVTVTGPGGVGKTRLAQAVAARSVLPVVRVLSMTEVAPRPAHETAHDTSPSASFRSAPIAAEGDREGARGGASDVEQLAREMLLGVGERPAPAGDPRRELAGALTGTGTLLVLDDCEHIAESLADLLGPVLAGAPELRVLVTSRRPLDLAAERVYRLAPLEPAAAAVLFRERALAARPHQLLAPAELERLMPTLEGIPLAIELAAARTRVMSVSQLAQRLSHDLSDVSGPRDLPARQRTLTAVIEWSWNLLDDPQRRALSRIALLADGFTLETAEVVLGAQAPVLIDGLVSQSLLSVTEGDGPERSAAAPRFHMLAAVREFARRVNDPDQRAEDQAAIRAWALGLCRSILVGTGDEAHRPASRGPARDGADPDGVLAPVLAEEAGIVEELRRALEAWERDPDADADLEGACVMGAALIACWSFSWGYPQLAAWAPRLMSAVATPASDPVGARARTRVLYRLCVSTWLLGPLPERVRLAIPAEEAHDDAEGAAIRRLARARRADWPRLVDDEDVRVAWAAGSCVSSDLENAGDVAGALALTDRLLQRCRTARFPEVDLIELSMDRLRLLLELGRYEQGARECSRMIITCDSAAVPQRGRYLQLLEMQRRCCRVYLDPTPEAAAELLREFGSAELPGTAMTVLSFIVSEMKVLTGRVVEAARDNRRFLADIDARTAQMPDGGPWELYALATCLVIDSCLGPAQSEGLDLVAVRRRAARALARAVGGRRRGERDLPTVASLAAGLGLAVMVAARVDGPGAPALPPTAGRLGAELLAVALRAGHNQTCLLLSRERLLMMAEEADAEVLHEMRDLVEHLGRSECAERMMGLVTDLSEWL